MRVLLPAPFSPNSVCTSPARTSKSMLSLASTPGKRLVTPRISSSAVSSLVFSGVLDMVRAFPVQSSGGAPYLATLRVPAVISPISLLACAFTLAGSG